jgi:hypothetical protein
MTTSWTYFNSHTMSKTHPNHGNSPFHWRFFPVAPTVPNTPFLSQEWSVSAGPCERQFFTLRWSYNRPQSSFAEKQTWHAETSYLRDEFFSFGNLTFSSYLWKTKLDTMVSLVLTWNLIEPTPWLRSAARFVVEVCKSTARKNNVIPTRRRSSYPESSAGSHPWKAFKCYPDDSLDSGCKSR